MARATAGWLGGLRRAPCQLEHVPQHRWHTSRPLSGQTQGETGGLVPFLAARLDLGGQTQGETGGLVPFLAARLDLGGQTQGEIGGLVAFLAGFDLAASDQRRSALTVAQRVTGWLDDLCALRVLCVELPENQEEQLLPIA